MGEYYYVCWLLVVTSLVFVFRCRARVNNNCLSDSSFAISSTSKGKRHLHTTATTSPLSFLLFSIFSFGPHSTHNYCTVPSHPKRAFLALYFADMTTDWLTAQQRNSWPMLSMHSGLLQRVADRFYSKAMKFQMLNRRQSWSRMSSM
jgi:hypothetical protein